MLTARQLRFYTYTVDIWRQADSPPAGADFGKYSLLTSNVPSLFISSREADRPSPLGRTKAVEEFSMDRFAFDLTVSIRDTDVLHLIAGPNSSPDVGRWFAVHGNPQRFARRANRQRVLAKGCPVPAGTS
jgi:hypothetical protein